MMKTTNGIFLIDSLGKMLVTHPTLSPMDNWSIPKGLTDEGETSLESTYRELFEETSIDLEKEISLNDNLVVAYNELSSIKYKSNEKRLNSHIFIISEPWSEMDLDLKCESMFIEPKSGKEYPENDITKWVTFDFCIQNLHETQVKKLSEVINFYVNVKYREIE